ncbi:hypothetical protein [Arthrobacter bambusae]|uniref:hypothetical protein n=1 Tax=Arthrobacter bambusae TaxID=1338426 RepID=UPI002783B8E2|nr:hypothetical protein [Arthrobacter bambusae]MDQ0212557.1 hypothetical protein [Arthrobacter bambusae]MDQ0236939.1 hypothetical protein [Arthrobacter bambusae]
MTRAEKLLNLTIEYQAACEADNAAQGLDYMRTPDVRDPQLIAEEYEQTLRELLQAD